MDQAVKIDNVRDAVGFDPVTLFPTKRKVVTYHVGTHGPFTLDTPAEKFTADYVASETQKVADTLRATGAIPAAG